MNGHAETAGAVHSAPKDNGSRRKIARVAAISLPPDQSAALRDRLLGEVAILQSAADAASWARNGITAKNSLSATDAKLVEQAFELILLEFSRSENAEPARPVSDIAAIQASTEMQAAPSFRDNDAPKGIDKSVLTLAEPRRYRNKEHLRFVAQQACLVCGRKPSDPHHLRFMQPRALGRKVSDEFVAPLCRIHHREAHRSRDERAWWKQAGIDPIKVARKLWRSTRLNRSSPQPSLGAQRAGIEAALKSDGAVGKASA
jgi:hypothetical protein